MNISMTGARNSIWATFSIICLMYVGPISAQWTNLGPGGGGSHRSLAFSPGPDDKLVIGADVGGFYVSEPSSNYRQFSIRNKNTINYYINSLQFHPADSSVIYAGTKGGIAKSIDGGLTWQMKRNGFRPFPEAGYAAPVYPIAIDPNNPSVVYAGLGFERPLGYGFGTWDVLGYVYKTVDGGESWTEIRVGVLPDQTGTNRQSIMSIVIDPLNSAKLYLLSQKKLFFSTDGGMNWGEQTTLPYTDATYTALVVKRDDPNVILVTYALRGANRITGVLKSTDGGSTWVEKASWSAMSSSEQGINHIRLHPTDPNTFFITFAASTQGLYRSADGGESWIKINSSVQNIPPGSAWFPSSQRATDVAVDPDNPNIICYLSNNDGAVYLSQDSGQSWEQISTVRNADGTYRSTGLNILVANDIVVRRSNPAEMLFGYNDRSLLKSADGGQSFFKGSDPVYNQTAHVLDMAVDPDNPDTVYVARKEYGSAANTGIYRTNDFGGAFVKIGGGTNGLAGTLIHDIEIDPNSPSSARIIYAASEDAGIFKSSDGGLNWIAINTGLPATNLQLYDLAVDPTDSQVLYAGARVSSVSGYVAKSIDGGNTWNIVLGRDKDGILRVSEVDIRTVVIDPFDHRIIYAGNRDSQGKGVNKIFWWSADGGANWNYVPGDAFNIGDFHYDCATGLSGCRDYHLQTITPDPATPGLLYAGFGDSGRDHRFTGGIYISNDHGLNWALFDDAGLQHFIANKIVIDHSAIPPRLYIVSGGNDIYRYGGPPASPQNSANLSVTIEDGPDPVLHGGTVTYTVMVTNNAGPYSTGAATNVTITGLPGCVLPNIESGSSASCTVSITADTTGTQSRTVTVSAAEVDPDTTNNSATAITTVNPAADLSVVLGVSPDPVLLGGVVSYTVMVSNAGPSTATGVTVSGLPGCILSATDIPSGGSAECAATVTADMVGALTRTVTVSGSEADPDGANNSATTTTTVNPVADLSITLNGSPDPVLHRGTVNYTVTVNNAGPSEASGVTVSGLAGCTLSSSGIASGGSATCTASVTADSDGTLSRTVMVSGAEFDPNNGNNTATADTTVTPVTDLSITLNDGPDPVNTDSPLTYTVTVTNGGPSAATGVTTSHTLPPGVSGSATSSQGGCTGSGPITCNLGNLANGQGVSITITATPGAEALFDATPATVLSVTTGAAASVSGAEYDPNGANNSASVTTTVNLTCQGQPVTLRGTGGNDGSSSKPFAGGVGVDVIHTLGGNDWVDGKGSNDTICGGAGDDDINGGGGSDVVSGGAGSDVCDGGGGVDLTDGTCESTLNIP